MAFGVQELEEKKVTEKLLKECGMPSKMNNKYSNLFFIMIYVFVLSGCKEIKKEYYPNGNVRIELELENEVADGYFREYYNDGQLKIEGRYKNGLKEGIHSWYYSNGGLKQENELKDGVLHGFHKEYYNNGVLKKNGVFVNGIQDEEVTTYYPSGKLETKEFYKNGKSNRVFEEFYENGNKLMYAELKDGVTLFYEKYDESGVLLSEYRQVDIVELNSDTIVLGELYSVVIKVAGRIKPNHVSSMILCYPDNYINKYDFSSSGKFIFNMTESENKKGDFFIEITDVNGGFLFAELVNSVEKLEMMERGEVEYSYRPKELGRHLLLCEYVVVNKDGSKSFPIPIQLRFNVVESVSFSTLSPGTLTHD
jgi:antitoxin component YwqK of YwqJK toxin-antitoxin module